MKQSQQNTLDQVASWYTTEGFYADLVQMGYSIIKTHIHGKQILEIGPADGSMTQLLVDDGYTVEVVEPAKKYAQLLRKKFTSILIHQNTIESFSTQKTYETIILAHVLEHIEHPVQTLSKIRSLMNKHSRCIIVVPNAQSLHRRLGVAMGMLKELNELHEYDRKLGHFRVYDFKSLKADILAAGLNILAETGIMIKPLSNNQMALWDKKTIQGLFHVGKDLPELCAEIVAVCTL